MILVNHTPFWFVDSDLACLAKNRRCFLKLYDLDGFEVPGIHVGNLLISENVYGDTECF